jgi:hypothetical protein
VQKHRLFGSWLRGIAPKLQNQFLLGATAPYWALLLNRNDMVFEKAKSNSFLQVIFRAIYWARAWVLHKEEERPTLKEACRPLT